MDQRENIFNNIIDKHSIQNKVLHSLIWSGGIKYLGQLITWCITILVIRILKPEDYGLLSISMVYTGFLLIISELGLGAAVVQKKDISSFELRQIFGFILFTHFIFSTLVYLCSPLLSMLYSEPRLIAVLKLLSVNFIILSLYIIDQALFIKEMNFKTKSLIDLTGNILSSIIILLLAISGSGVYALVWGTISFNIISCILYKTVNRNFYLPEFKLKKSAKFLIFGGYITASRIIWYLYSRADIFIGGRILGNQSIGIYSVGKQLSFIPSEKLLPILNQIAFPAYSSIQNDLETTRKYFLKSIKLTSLILFPVYWGAIVILNETIQIIFGSKWNQLILPIQILCLVMPIRALSTMIPPMIQGLGRPDIIFKNSVISFFIVISSISIGVNYKLAGLCISWLIGCILVLIIVLKRTMYVIDLNSFKFFYNLKYAVMASLIMMITTYQIKLLLKGTISDIYLIFCVFASGFSIYAMIIYFLEKAAIKEFLILIKKMIFNFDSKKNGNT